MPLTIGHRDQPTNSEERYIKKLLDKSNFKLINDNEFVSNRSKNDEDIQILKPLDSVLLYRLK